MGIDSVGLGLPGGIAGWRMVQSRKPSDFSALSRDPELKRDIAYLREKLPAKPTAKDLLADPRLQRMVLQAYGLDSQVGMTTLMRKVLESNPADAGSVAARMTDPRYRQLASALNYGGLQIPELPATASEATVAVEGLGNGGVISSFTGKFGGVAVLDVDTSGATSRAQLAATLQDAFRRADGGRSDITVSVFATDLVFSDAKGRAAAQGFSFAASNGASAALTGTTAGRPATPAQGGPKVKDPRVVEDLVQRYTQSRFEAAVGVGSDTLRVALYAKRTLPQVGNWYTVLADQNLARVVRGALGLPDAMVKVDVDRQVAMLKGRMDIADLKDPAKLGKLLDRFVARAAAAEGTADVTNSMLMLVQPLSGNG